VTVQQAIDAEIEEARKVMPWGDPLVSFDPKDVLIDRGRKRIYVTMQAVKRAFEKP
jgi:hypothetical protein